MKNKNLIIAGLGFILCLISVFFGASIYNANENFLVEHLNDMDQLDYYDVDAVPALSRIVSIITLPFIVIILAVEIFIALKSKLRPVKNIARGISVAFIFLLCLDFAIISNSANFDFSQWGFFWVIFGIIAIGGNMISVFVKGN